MNEAPRIMTATQKTKAHKIAQVLRIAQRIEHFAKNHPQEARKAARWFALWLCIINKQPIFCTQPTKYEKEFYGG